MDFFIEIIVLVFCILLSLAICYFKWMFLTKQNFYIDFQLQYKDVEKCSTRGRDQYRRQQRPRVEPCERPRPCGRPVTFEEPVTCQRPVTFEQPCSPPAETPARPKRSAKCPPPMIIPSCDIPSDSSDSDMDCCNDMEDPCNIECESICSSTEDDEKCKHRPRSTPEQTCTKNKKRSKSKQCKKQMSDACTTTCSDNKSFKNTCTDSFRNTCSRFGSKIRFFSKDKKKHVDCLVLVDTSKLPLNNQPPNKEKIAIVPVSCLKCPELLTKNSEDRNDSSSDVQTSSVRKISTSPSCKRKKIMERAIEDENKNLSGEGKVFQGQKNDNTINAVLTQKVPSCSSHNLEKLREKRKERKKTLMKLQYESGKLDDINKRMSEASNSGLDGIHRNMSGASNNEH